jgi:hypothetical protein
VATQHATQAAPTVGVETIEPALDGTARVLV